LQSIVAEGKRYLLADLPIRWTVAGILSLALRHILSLLCASVPPRAWTVIHTGPCVYPDLRIGITRVCPRRRSSFLLRGRGRGRAIFSGLTHFPIGRAVPLLLGLSLGHISAAFCRAVQSGARAVIHTALCVHPYADFLLFSFRLCCKYGANG
jgi:hypothetical protein